MGYRYTPRQIRADNVVHAGDAARALSRYAGVINGGIDRDNIPDDAVDDSHVVEGAFYKYVVDSGLQMDDALNPQADYSADGQAGVLFRDYNGGWYIHQDDSVVEQVHEGILHLEFRCVTWHSTLESHDQDKYIKFGLYVNGNRVVEIGKIHATPQNVQLQCAIPTPSQQVTVEIGWIMSPPDNAAAGDSPTDRAFLWTGGQLVLINRYR